MTPLICAEPDVVHTVELLPSTDTEGEALLGDGPIGQGDAARQLIQQV